MTDVALPVAPAHAAGPAVPDFEIVPRKGLPIVAVVFVALVAAIASNKLWPLEFLHVVVRRGVDDHRPVPRARARADHRPHVDPRARSSSPRG